MSYARFAIYHVPPKGPLAEFGANWLSWDVVTGREGPQFDLPGLHDITMTPRKYGFHDTLKPPFRLKEGQTIEALEKAVLTLAGSLAPAACKGLKLTQLGRFLALTPDGSLGGYSVLPKVACAILTRSAPLPVRQRLRGGAKPV